MQLFPLADLASGEEDAIGLFHSLPQFGQDGLTPTASGEVATVDTPLLSL